jgi:DNA-binding transcriptional ArsR family regulator
MVTLRLQLTMHALDALGNPVRRKILRQLRDSPLSVHELAARFPISRPAISRHLHVLTKSGLVEARGGGARHQYAVRVKGFAPVREFLDEFWDAALARLEELSRK